MKPQTETGAGRSGVVVDPPLDGYRAKFAYVLLAVYLVGFHLRLSLNSGSGATLVPMYPMLIAGALLALTQANRMIRRAGHMLLALLGLITIHPLLASAPGSSDVGNLLSAAQLLCAIISALAVVYTASRLPTDSLRRLFFGFWALLILVALMETYGLQPVFRSIQDILYAGSGRGVYAADLRDTLLYGKVRPTALASEPSFLADSWMSMTILVFLLHKHRGSTRSWVRLGIMIAIGFIVAPSMKIVFYLAALMVWHFWPRGRYSLPALIVGLPLAAYALYTLIGDRGGSIISKIGSSETGSFFARVTVAPKIGSDVLESFPILGYGIGNFDGLTPVAQGVWQRTGGYALFPWYKGFGAQDLMVNGFWWQWVSLGLLGGLAFTFLIAKLLQSLDVAHPMRTVLCAWVIWYSGFAFVDPASWFIVALLALPGIERATPLESDVPDPLAPSRPADTR